jgi:hypothetical protein
VIQVALISAKGVVQPLYGKDAFGVEWHTTAFDGWDGPGVRSESFPVIRRHGVFPGEWLYDSRTMGIHGFFWAPTEGAMWAARNRLAAASSAFSVNPGLMTVKEPGNIPESFFVTFWRSDRLQMTTKTANAVEFQIPLLAADPRKYDLTQKTQSIVLGHQTIVSDGTIETDPLVTIHGGSTNPTLFNMTVGGNGIKFNTVLNPGSNLVANWRDRTVLINGVSHYEVVDVNTAWWPIIPGDNDIYLTSDGGGSGDIVWNDAFI